MITDLTEGKPSKILWSFSIPMLLSMVFQQLYNIVDSYFVARISENAMEALSLVFPIQNFINAMPQVQTSVRLLLFRSCSVRKTLKSSKLPFSLQ